MRALLVIVVACTPGMRPALDHAGPRLARSLQLEGEARPPEVYGLGAGCYVGRRHEVIACSIDDLPAGELLCAVEPDEESTASADDPDLDSFVAKLNRRDCRKRWYDSFVVPPASVQIRDLEPSGAKLGWAVPLAELEVRGLPSTLELEAADVREVCLRGITTDHWTTPLCFAPGGAYVEREPDVASGIGLRFQSRLSRATASAVFAHTTSAAPRQDHVRCAAVEVTLSNLRCVSDPRSRRGGA